MRSPPYRSGMSDLDESILQCLILDGRAPFSRIAEVVGASEQTVARRYRAMRDAGRLRVLVGRSPFERGRRAWALRVRCRPGTAEPLARALARQDDVRWVALVAGGGEVACTVAADAAPAPGGVLARLPRTSGVLGISAQQLLRSFAGARDEWTVFDSTLSEGQVTELRGARSARDGAPVEVPDADLPLAEAVARDGRASVASLARELGWPPARVSSRLTALLGGRGLFTATDWVPEAFGFDASAILHLAVAPESIVEVCTALAGHRATGFVAATTGATSVMALVIRRTADELFSYVTEEVGALRGIASLEIVPYLARVKQSGCLVEDGRLVA